MELLKVKNMLTCKLRFTFRQNTMMESTVSIKKCDDLLKNKYKGASIVTHSLFFRTLTIEDLMSSAENSRRNFRSSINLRKAASNQFVEAKS